MNIGNMTDQALCKELLRRYNWRQMDLAKELGYKVHAHVSSIVNGKGGLSGAARKIAEMLLKDAPDA